MRKIIVAIFLVLTFLCSCSDLNNAIKLKPDDAIKLKPDAAIAHSNRGIAYAKLGQYQRAIDDYNEAIRLQPDLAEI
jgi:tetratricopeptide (TPR) repeat protein